MPPRMCNFSLYRFVVQLPEVLGIPLLGLHRKRYHSRVCYLLSHVLATRYNHCVIMMSNVLHKRITSIWLQQEIYCLRSSPAGAVVTSLNDQPILKDVVCIAVPRVAARWYDLGLALDIQPFVLDGVAHQQEKADRPREMFAKWLETSPDTGSQPRTWQSVLDAVGTICGSAVMEGICTAVQKTRIPTPGKSSLL